MRTSEEKGLTRLQKPDREHLLQWVLGNLESLLGDD